MRSAPGGNVRGGGSIGIHSGKPDRNRGGIGRREKVFPQCPVPSRRGFRNPRAGLHGWIFRRCLSARRWGRCGIPALGELATRQRMLLPSQRIRNEVRRHGAAIIETGNPFRRRQHTLPAAVAFAAEHKLPRAIKNPQEVRRILRARLPIHPHGRSVKPIAFRRAVAAGDERRRRHGAGLRFRRGDVPGRECRAAPVFSVCLDQRDPHLRRGRRRARHGRVNRVLGFTGGNPLDCRPVRAGQNPTMNPGPSRGAGAEGFREARGAGRGHPPRAFGAGLCNVAAHVRTPIPCNACSISIARRK